MYKRQLRDHGQAKKYYHDFEGYNGRLDALQCGILRIKLRYLEEWNEKRRQIASLYSHFLTLNSEHETRNIIVPFIPSWSKPVFHLYIIRTPKRDELQKYLSDNGIGTSLHYPIPLHLQKAYSNNGFGKGMFPITEKIASEILSLPMYPQLTEKQVEYVVTTIKNFFTTP